MKSNVNDHEANQQRDRPFHPAWHFLHLKLVRSLPTGSPRPAPLAAPVLHDTRKRLRIEARSANQHAVEIHLRHQSLNIVRLDAAAVENPEGSRMVSAERLRRTLANEPMHGRSNFRGSRVARSDCPDRFVSYQNTGEFLGGQRAGAALKLRLADVFGVPGLAVGKHFANADDGSETGGEGGLGL